MKLLTLDTATSVFSVALSHGERLLGEAAGTAGQLTAARLTPAIQGLFDDCALSPKDLDGFAVTIGPGSFTGIRVGIAFIKGLAYATGKQVVGLSSLELLAMNARESQLPVCPLFDARRGEVYGGLYSFVNGGETLLADMASPPEKFIAMLAGETIFLGDGAVRYREVIAEKLGSRAVFADPGLNNPSAASGITLALEAFAAGKAVNAAALLPSYLRLSEAELNRTLK